jgi:hypothetical protein
MKKIIMFFTGAVIFLFYMLAQFSSCAQAPKASDTNSSGASVPSFTLVTNWKSPNVSIKSVFQNNANIYAVSYSELIVFDDSMSQLGTFPATNINDLVIGGSGPVYAYMALGTYQGSGGVFMADVTEPTNIYQTNLYKDANRSGNALAVNSTGTIVYTADDKQGYQKYAVDLTTPQFNVLVQYALNGVSPNDSAYPGVDICVDSGGTYAYVAAKEGGVFVIKIGTGVVAQITAPLTIANAVALNGNYLAVADLIGGIFIFSIGPPNSPDMPNLIGNYKTGGTAYDVAMDGNDLYIADGLNGVLKVTKTPPPNTTFTLEKQYKDGSVAYKVFYSALYTGNVYAALGKDGIVVLR